MPQERNMTIHFMDGTKVAYDFPQQIDDISAMASKLEALLDKQFLAIEDEGVMHFYPVNNIKSIQLHPAPQKLPDFVIQGASAAETY